MSPRVVTVGAATRFSRVEKGGMSMAAIARAAAKKFNCDYDKTLATCRCRPTHMRKAGRKPQWITEEAPAK